MRKNYGWILALLFAIALSPNAFLRGKPVHVSVDDVSVFERLSKGSYESVFDEPFLNRLQTWHRRTRAKFTLYVYETTVGDVPDYYWAQFKINSDWLKIGFHATSAEEPITQNDDEFIASYNRLDSILMDKAPQNKTNTLRLHYWKASPAETAHLRDNGIQCLLSTDQDDNSYSLSSEDDSQLQTAELLQKDGLVYKKTDFRIENSNVFAELFNNSRDKEIFFFTHEWALQRGNCTKTSILLTILRLYGVKFVA